MLGSLFGSFECFNELFLLKCRLLLVCLFAANQGFSFCLLISTFVVFTGLFPDPLVAISGAFLVRFSAFPFNIRFKWL